jgi:hypothetical protein
MIPLDYEPEFPYPFEHIPDHIPEIDDEEEEED